MFPSFGAGAEVLRARRAGRLRAGRGPAVRRDRDADGARHGGLRRPQGRRAEGAICAPAAWRRARWRSSAGPAARTSFACAARRRARPCATAAGVALGHAAGRAWVRYAFPRALPARRAHGPRRVRRDARDGHDVVAALHPLPRGRRCAARARPARGLSTSRTCIRRARRCTSPSWPGPGADRARPVGRGQGGGQLGDRRLPAQRSPTTTPSGATTRRTSAPRSATSASRRCARSSASSTRPA